MPRRKSQVILVRSDSSGSSPPRRETHAQKDILTDIRTTHHWPAFESFLQDFIEQQPENLPLLQKAFGRTLQASWITAHLLAPMHQLADRPDPEPTNLLLDWDVLEDAFGEGVDFFPQVPTEERMVNLTRDVVITAPWAPEGTLKTLRTIGTDRNNPWRYDADNHLLDGYLYFGVFWCSNGYHSTMTGILKQEGEMPVTQTFNPTFLLENVQVSPDGTAYLHAGTGAPIGPVRSQEFAAIFRMAQERLKLGIHGY